MEKSKSNNQRGMEATMTGPDLKVVTDILQELRIRWPKGSSPAKKPNVVSFLNFRLKQRVPNHRRARCIASIGAVIE